MEKIRYASLTLLMASCAFAWSNVPPIPDRYPGKDVGVGNGDFAIDIELIYDLTCSGCQALHPEFLAFLDMQFLNGPVKDAVRVKYAFFPLPYHHGCWIVSKLIPYMTDLCLAD